MRVLGRRRGPGQGARAAAQDRGHLLHPGGRRARRGAAVPGRPVPGAAAGHGPLPRRQGLRGRRHPRHGPGAHPPRGVRRAGVAVPGGRAVAQVPVRGDGRDARRDRHADGGHRRHGVLPPHGRQEGRGGRRRRAEDDGGRAPPPPRRRRGLGGGLRRRRAPRARARDVRAGARADDPRRQRAPAPPRRLSGAGAGRGGALAGHRHVAGRLGFPQHGAAARPGTDVPPALRGHRPRRMHCPGQVPAQVRGGDGALLLPDDPGRRGHRHRDILRVRRDEPHGAGGAGAAGGRGGRDPGVHGARRHPRRGLHERQGAEPGAAAARAQRRPAARGWHDVHARHLGLTNMHDHGARHRTLYYARLIGIRLYRLDVKLWTAVLLTWVTHRASGRFVLLDVGPVGLGKGGPNQGNNRPRWVAKEIRVFAQNTLLVHFYSETSLLFEKIIKLDLYRLLGGRQQDTAQRWDGSMLQPSQRAATSFFSSL